MCDTFIAMPQATSDGSVIFGKNSDREANEAQSLEYHQQKDYKKDENLKCTYIEIPQVEKTYGVLISRPFWMWGAEMGVNEKGVVIGNEAVFTKLEVNKTGVLTGMDLLRLALERSDSAKAAKQIIIDLLQQHGQGGLCGYEDKNFTYHNSFLIADKNEAWVLETAGKFWATKKVENYYAISNGLTIGSDYDEIHPDTISYAYKKGWVKDEFNFAYAFSDFLYTTFSACKKRQNRAIEILKNNYQKISIKSAIEHLRDHNSENFQPSKPLLGNTICAHAGNLITRNASQTTGSMIVHLTKKNTTVWVTATSAPCISMFKPLWFDNIVLPDLGSKPDVKFDINSFWWKHELLHREVIKNFQNRIKYIKDERNNAEELLLDSVYKKNKKGIEISKAAFENHFQLIDKWIEEVGNIEIIDAPNVLYKYYWKKLNKKVKLPL